MKIPLLLGLSLLGAPLTFLAAGEPLTLDDIRRTVRGEEQTPEH